MAVAAIITLTSISFSSGCSGNIYTEFINAYADKIIIIIFIRHEGRNRIQNIKELRTIMVALCNRADHYIFILFFLLLFYFLA